MTYKALNTADLHLTDRTNDSYRWNFFPWLSNQISSSRATHLNILGDITHFKNNHSANLVNSIINKIGELAKQVPVYIISGNHDYTDPTTPYFKFLSKIDNVTFINKPRVITIEGKDCLYLPHSHNPREDWKDLDFGGYFRIFFHQCLLGSKSATGHTLDGLDPKVFDEMDDDCWAIGGDIHEPQGKDNWIYCGAPYPIAFGDEYQPRVLLDDGKIQSINYATVRKVTVNIKEPSDLSKYIINNHDQVKVVFNMKKSDYVSFKDYKQEVSDKIKECGASVSDITLNRVNDAVKADESKPKAGETPKGILTRFCQSKGLNVELAGLGSELLA
jgi:hypothetical protein